MIRFGVVASVPDEGVNDPQNDPQSLWRDKGETRQAVCQERPGCLGNALVSGWVVGLLKTVPMGRVT